MAKSDQFYFDNLIASAQISCEAAQYLNTCLSDYDPARVEQMIRELHDIENRGDKQKHEMSAALAKAFVTPFDREDLADISNSIDEVTDSIEEVLQRFYVDSIATVLPEALTFSNRIIESCRLMTEMLRELPNFKKPQKLHEMIVNLSHLEEECDKLYLQATRQIREHTDDVLTIIFWRDIYDRLEKCADACEYVGDCVETIVMKNT